jgi:hypothetical protein
MKTTEAFAEAGRLMQADPLMALLDRWRRSAVIDALRGYPDVAEAIPSGSLARGTRPEHVHNVDLIVVFDQAKHADWGGGGSALAALEHLQTALRGVRKAGSGRLPGLVYDTQLRNHGVKCSLDLSLGPYGLIIPGAPAVDVMPAVRAGSHLRVPERSSDRWLDVDLEPVMGVLAAQQREWSNFDQVVRMIKDWAQHSGLRMNSLAVEVLVLTYLPRPALFESMSCSDAIDRFFEAASRAHITRLADPVGRSGEIDPHMDYAALRKALARSAGLAGQAVEAEQAWPTPDHLQGDVTHPSTFWQGIFGQHRFRRPRVWYWNAGSPAERPSPRSRRWFDELAEPADESAWSWRPWNSEPPSPRSASSADPAGPQDSSREPGILKPDDLDQRTSAQGESAGTDARQSPTPGEFTLPISIYLSDEHNHEDVEVAVGEWLAHAGLTVEERDEPVIGSWFRRMRAGVGHAVHSPTAAEAALTAVHAADSRLLLGQDAMVTATLLQNLGPVIASLQPTREAILRVGALLIVKIDWAVHVFQLTAAQQAILDHKPQLAASPLEIIAALQLSAPNGTGIMPTAE